MELIQNFPFFGIMLYLAGGVTCCVLKPKYSKFFCLFLNAAVTAMMVCVLFFTLRTGQIYVFLMGHFPAPWGNELRIGPLEALMASVLSGVMTLTLLGGMRHIFEDVEPEKVSLYFTVCNLLMVSLLALIYTNDIFTGYVFVEINTIASCALVMIRYRSGKALAATMRYLMMSLLGSGLFLIGIVILYSLTGHLLMEPAKAAVTQLIENGSYSFPLTVVIGLFTVGIGLKSALWPFHEWLPDAHGSSTVSSSGILSGLVLKGYIFLLIKLYCRVLAPALSVNSGISSVLYLFGLAAMLAGSLSAMREQDIKRMLAYSSVAQIGYIYTGIGLASEAGLLAACIQIIVHALTKPMLFCAAGGLTDVSDGSRQRDRIRGAGCRDPLSGGAFAVGAFSMIGIPFFAGFSTKFYLMKAVITAQHIRCVSGIMIIAVSTVLNALYYLPWLAVIFDKSSDVTLSDVKAVYTPEYIISILIFILFGFVLGFRSDLFAEIISLGLKAFG